MTFKIGISICLLFVSLGCNKFKDLGIEKEEEFVLSKNQFSEFDRHLSNLPMIIRYKDETNNRYVDFDIRKRTVELNKVWSFANPQPNTIYGEAGGIVFYISETSVGWGYGTPSSSVTAGSTTLNVQTICFAVDISAYAAMFAGQTGDLPFDGISAVMGLDADFSLLENSSSTNFGDYFSGLAEYFVYDFEASGDYEVVDWTNLSAEFPETLGFAMVFSFSSDNFGSFYFSKDGDISVNGGSMSFDGNYWGIEMDFSIISPDLSYDTYPGSGSMGC